MKQLGIRPLVHYYNRLDKEESGRSVAGKLLQNIERVPQMNIRTAAALCDTSEASLSRLARKAGYAGFHDLREQVGSMLKNYYTENRLIGPSLLENRDSVSVYFEALRGLLDGLESALSMELIDRAADLLQQASCVYYFGACDKFVRLEQDLCVSGKLVVICQEGDNLARFKQQWDKDTLVIVENPGYPWFQHNDLVHQVKVLGAKLLLITCAANRNLEHQADVTILLSGTKSGLDEFLFQTVMDVLSIEYRKRCMDGWLYE